MQDEWGTLDATALAALVAAGAATPTELVEAAVEAIERVNPTLNAVVHPLFAKARLAAAGPLPVGPFTGVPLAVKDAVAHTAGDPYHVGMRLLRDLGWTEAADAEIVRRFRLAGFVPVAKTNTPELATSDTTEPEAYGPTRNPWDPARSPGGSSGGSAAAVASGMVPLAHGNDMGGSIRVPASACGLVGMKPTRARTSLAPGFGEYWGPTTHEGVLTRSVRDTARALDAVAGPAPGDPYTAPRPGRPFADELGLPVVPVRIGVRTEVPVRRSAPHSECVRAVERTAAVLDRLGHRISADCPEALDEDLGDALVVFPVWVARELDRWSERTGHPIREGDVEQGNWIMAEIGRSVSATRYLAALEHIQGWARRMAAGWERVDVLLMPTMPEPPVLLGTTAGALDTRLVPYTLPFNLTGEPAISLPLHWSAEGLPIGVQLVAPQGREDVLLQLASQLEEAMPWHDRRPPVHVTTR